MSPASMRSNGSSVMSHAVLAGSPVVLAHGLGAENLSPRERRLQAKALEAGHAEGSRVGYERGLAEGMKAAQAEFASAREALEAGLAAVAGERRRLLADSRDAILKLALAVAGKVLHGEVRHNAEAAASVLDAALACVQDARAVRARVNPGDLERIRQARPDAPVPDVVADPAIGPGGCVVETDCGAIDATVDSQWEIVVEALEASKGAPDDGE